MPAAIGHDQPVRQPPKSRFTGPDRLSDGRVRVIKDALRVGTWFVTLPDQSRFEWKVSPRVLATLELTHKLARRNGVAFNLTASHGDLSTLIVPNNELYAPLDQVVSDGEILWASSYVTPDVARRLANPAMKVSPGVVYNWMDGRGNQYPMAMVHLAVTDKPVITGQGPFLAMANSQKGKGKSMFVLAGMQPLFMSTDAGADGDGGGGGGGESFKNLPATPDEWAITGGGAPVVIDIINALLPADMYLPDGTDENTVVYNAALLLQALQPGEEPVLEEPQQPEAPAVAASNRQPKILRKPGKAAPAGGGLVAQLKTQQAPAWALTMAAAVENVQQFQQQQTTGEQQRQRAAFEAEILKLGKPDGNRPAVPAAILNEKRQLAERLGSWDLGLLSGLRPTLAMSGGVKSMATAGAPDVRLIGADERPTAEQCKAAVAGVLARRGIVLPSKNGAK